MRPPICAICGKDFRKNMEKGGGVSFKLSESDKAYNQKFDKQGMVGHPRGFEWFCSRHIGLAEKYKHLTFAGAMNKMKSELTLLDRIRLFFKRKK